VVSPVAATYDCIAQLDPYTINVVTWIQWIHATNIIDGIHWIDLINLIESTNTVDRIHTD
jgi:hypothetical protein